MIEEQAASDEDGSVRLSCASRLRLALGSGGAHDLRRADLAAYVCSKAFANAVQAVDYAGLVSVGLFDAPLFGALAVAWMVLTIAITWPRFPRRTVPEFLGGSRDLLRGRG
jgi:hypothetical protein